MERAGMSTTYAASCTLTVWQSLGMRFSASLTLTRSCSHDRGHLKAKQDLNVLTIKHIVGPWMLLIEDMTLQMSRNSCMWQDMLLPDRAVNYYSKQTGKTLRLPNELSDFS